MVAFDSADLISVSWVALASSCASVSFALRHGLFQSVFALAHLALLEYVTAQEQPLLSFSLSYLLLCSGKLPFRELLLFCFQLFLPHPMQIILGSSLNSHLNSCEPLGFLS